MDIKKAKTTSGKKHALHLAKERQSFKEELMDLTEEVMFEQEFIQDNREKGFPGNSNLHKHSKFSRVTSCSKLSSVHLPSP